MFKYIDLTCYAFNAIVKIDDSKPMNFRGNMGVQKVNNDTML